MNKLGSAVLVGAKTIGCTVALPVALAGGAVIHTASAERSAWHNRGAAVLTHSSENIAQEPPHTETPAFESNPVVVGVTRGTANPYQAGAALA